MPVPIRYEYAFVGWFSHQNGQGIKYTDYNGDMFEKWSIYEDITLYACWTPISAQITSINQMRLSDQQIYSAKSEPFNIGLDIDRLREAGYTKLKISISGSCSEYDYRLNDRTRYFILSDAATDTDITSWSFIVKGFSGVNANVVSINSFNKNGLYKLQLVSDKSDAYNEKLLISGIIITIIAVK